MNLRLLQLFFCLFVFKSAFSQDLLIKRNGDEVFCKVMIINGDTVKYKVKEVNDSTDYFLLTSDIMMIKYSSGMKQIFPLFTNYAAPANQVGVSNRKPFSNYQTGLMDGRIYYKNKSHFIAGFGLGFVAPFTYFLPTIGGIAMMATPPPFASLYVHDTRIMAVNQKEIDLDTKNQFNDPEYIRGYKKGAMRKKTSNVAGGFGAGVGAGLLTFVIVILVVLGS